MHLIETTNRKKWSGNIRTRWYFYGELEARYFFSKKSFTHTTNQNPQRHSKAQSTVETGLFSPTAQQRDSNLHTSEQGSQHLKKIS